MRPTSISPAVAAPACAASAQTAHGARAITRAALLLCCLAVTACQPSFSDTAEKATAMPDLKEVQAKLAFSCAYEKDHLPPLNPEADQLYRYARWLNRQQLRQEDPARYPQMALLYRIAAAHDHYKANLELRAMIREGQAMSDAPVKEVVELTQQLIAQGIPGGYYDMGLLLQEGYGVQPDSELGLKYLRRAADLGNPEAQYAVGDMLVSLTIDHPLEYAIGNTMKKCAAEQGHGEAGIEYGIRMQAEKKYAEAVKYFQLATKAGDPSGPTWLSDGFDDGDPLNLALPKDAERSRRYIEIRHVLSDYSYYHPSVPELDDIVPLPPAKLPPWDGKIQWLKDFEANIPPPRPSEELLTRLAHAKGLDPATGRPDPQAQQALRAKQADAARLTPPSPDAVALGAICRSGDPCPQSGIWQPLLPGTDAYLRNYQPQYIAQGQPFPPGQMVRQPDGLLQRWRSPTESEAVIQWQLVSYS